MNPVIEGAYAPVINVLHKMLTRAGIKSYLWKLTSPIEITSNRELWMNGQLGNLNRCQNFCTTLYVMVNINLERININSQHRNNLLLCSEALYHLQQGITEDSLIKAYAILQGHSYEVAKFNVLKKLGLLNYQSVNPYTKRNGTYVKGYTRVIPA